MDERLFLLILGRMNANLSERWRKMDVQKAGLTHRDESATLEMVRAQGGIVGWTATSAQLLQALPEWRA